MMLRTKDEQKAYLDGYEMCAECIENYLTDEGKQKLECLLMAVRNAVEIEDLESQKSENIKLVIKIPKQMYLNAKTDMLCGSKIIVNAIKNGIPHETVTEFADRCRECGREKVLDKITAELKSVKEKWWYGVDNDCFMKLSDVIAVIDKYKAESEAAEQ